jgi:two-component system sensor histidine kinase/response regulator
MGGDVGVESRPGAGSTFWFTARLRKDARRTAAGHSAAAALRSPDSALALLRTYGGARILVAEDNEVNQDVALELLREAGLAGDIADNGERAVQMAKDSAYDLIIMDMHMPVMDGLAATRALRALEQCRNTPIIAMTANAFAEDRARCIDAGMNDHVGKPVDPDILYATLLNWLPKRAESVSETGAAEPEDSLAALQTHFNGVAGVDVSLGVKYALGKIASYTRRLRKYAALHGQSMAKLRRLVAEDEHHAAMHLAHSLKGAVSFLGATALQATLGELEAALLERATAQIVDPLTDAVEMQHQVFLAAIAALPTEDRAAPIMPVTPAQWGELRAALDQLTALLREDNRAANRLMRASGTLLRAVLGERTNELQRHIDRFEYPAALRTLRELRTLHSELTETGEAVKDT